MFPSPASIVRGVIVKSQRGKQARSVVIERSRHSGVNRASLLEPLDAPLIILATFRLESALLDQGNLGPNLEQDQFGELTPQSSLSGCRQFFEVEGRSHERPSSSR